MAKQYQTCPTCNGEGKVALTFGSYVRKRRQERGWTQAYLGSKVGVSLTTISYWETDYKWPMKQKVIRLAEAFQEDPTKMLQLSRLI